MPVGLADDRPLRAAALLFLTVLRAERERATLLLRDEVLLRRDETVRTDALLRDDALLLRQDALRLFAPRPDARRANARPRLTEQPDAGR